MSASDSHGGGTENRSTALPPLLPGTRVVLRVPAGGTEGKPSHPAGAVAVVIRTDPGVAGEARGGVQVRFIDGLETVLGRGELDVLGALRQAAASGGAGAGGAPDGDLREHAIYRCVVGSRAYGLDEPGSDVDRRGIYLAPAARHWSLHGVPEQLEDDAAQECIWEVQKFLVLALKANPNVLECLHTPLVELATPLAEELLAMRASFLSRLLYQTYAGYVTSQFRKLEQDLRARGEVRWKHAMHLIRLLLAGVAALRDGVVPVRVEEEHRPRLLAIRRGEWAWAEVDAWRRELHDAFDAAFASTRLPERPDYARADAFLVRARREAARRELAAEAGARAGSGTP